MKIANMFKMMSYIYDDSENGNSYSNPFEEYLKDDEKNASLNNLDIDKMESIIIDTINKEFEKQGRR